MIKEYVGIVTGEAPESPAICTAIRPMAPIPNTATASPMRTLPSRTAAMAKSAGSRQTADFQESPSGIFRHREATVVWTSRKPP